ncbi:Contactin-2 [Liparis tanakae]|uniref:Contactin-2 n=1 Tax=Liparis tanakae TaxID=230148 RepID=A0A4Z2JD11_9TELE|nr:Contactin-2 [Liparis tanakae]
MEKRAKKQGKCQKEYRAFDWWKLNESFILPRPGSRYSLMGGNLRISHLNKEEDVGIYQCLASNSFGTIVSREASLHIASDPEMILGRESTEVSISPQLGAPLSPSSIAS